jgi:Fe-S-cluster-containing hydrogenase component 2
MLYVDENRCSGCGDCVAVCPTDAIQLARGTAAIDQERCTQCEACFHVCPEQAILSVSERDIVPQSDRQGAIAVSRAGQARPLAVRVAPALAAGLVFLGREVIPRAATYILDLVDRRMSASRAGTAGGTTAAPPRGPGSGGAGRRRKRRRGA